MVVPGHHSDLFYRQRYSKVVTFTVNLMTDLEFLDLILKTVHSYFGIVLLILFTTSGFVSAWVI